MKAEILFCLSLLLLPMLSAQDEEIKLSLDKLFSLKVTSVSGTAMDLKKSPAAIYVITAEDFKKQGHRTLPDALRAVPGFHVRKVNANNWAITARGSNGRFANKLLVLIDGRSVYTPLFSGVYWEIQDLPLEDIDRIEVIRGPGATLWGANAVNGVINIVTKGVRETQGGYLKLGVGTLNPYETEFRYGYQMSDNVFMKVWGKRFERGESKNESTGNYANDSWDGGHYGIKLDWFMTPKDTHSFQFNFSKLNIGQENNALTFDRLVPDIAPVNVGFLLDINEGDAARGISGIPVGAYLFSGLDRRSEDTTWRTANIMWDWTRNISASEGLVFKAYYDFTHGENGLYTERRHTFDTDFRHWFDINDTNSFIWGVSFRTTEDSGIGSDNVTMVPLKRRIDTYSAFLQNTTQLTSKLSLMLGSKIEYNDQTQIEIQPSARLTYEYSPSTIFWGSWSRAVRRPSRAEDDARLFTAGANTFTGDFGALSGVPQFALLHNRYIGGALYGSRDVDSEELLAYEAGMRTDFFDKKVTLDLATFFNDYNNLVGQEAHPTDPAAFILNNKGSAHTYGIEASVKYFPRKDLNFMFNYTWFRRNDSSNVVSDPEHVLFTAVNYQICKNLSWHTTAFYGGNIPDVDVRPYIKLDSGLLWKVNKHWDVSLWGKNLLEPSHKEEGVNAESFFDDQAYEVQRSFFLEATYRF